MFFEKWNWMILMMMPRGGYVFWYIHIFMFYDDFMRCHEDTVMLRSTTGFYGRPVLEVAYGEIIFSLHRGYLRDISSGRVVRMSAWCITHIWHTRVNTSVGSVYIFFGFQGYKNLYVLCFQIYTYYKRTLVDSDLILVRWGSKNVFRPPKSLKEI